MTQASPEAAQADGHTVSDANDHAKQKGDGSRAALPVMPAGKRPMRRRIKVSVRAPFLPDHPQARHGLSGHSKDRDKPMTVDK